jgi:hypothetical protein
MEFLDPQKQKAHKIRLMIGYVLVAIAIVLATIILLYNAYGFGLKNGQVVQNGLVFVSSTPTTANVLVNGQLYKDKTNTRLLLPGGQYTIEVQRDGYRTWRRAISVEGGSVSRLDYPLLIPSKLATATTKAYTAPPALALQSLDHRWVLVQPADSPSSFDSFDLNNPQNPATPVTIPAGVLTPGTGAQNFALAEWSNDNRHVLLRHSYEQDGHQSEHIMLDREEPLKTFNLTKTLGANPTVIQLHNQAYDQYYVYDQAAQKVSTASVKKPEPVLVVDHVLAFKSYADDLLLYVTDTGAPAGRANIMLRQAGAKYTIRQVASGGNYALDLARFNNALYVVAGAASEQKTYVYKNPGDTLKNNPKDPLVPLYILKLADVSYVAFSESDRFILAENGSSFAVYDTQNDKGYAYQLKTSLDVPQTHATWLDGYHLTAVSGGQAHIFDFDGANVQPLVAANPAFVPLFDSTQKYLYSFALQTSKDATGKDVTQTLLTNTALRAPQDL